MRIAEGGTRKGGERGLSPPLRYFAASALEAARAFAASDILFRVAAEITLFFAGTAAFTAADFLAAVDFFAGVLAGGVAERTYFRFLGATG
jgi:hypothetical protein